MKKLLTILVSFWILAFAQNLHAQGGTTTPNLGMTVPNYQPGTWGEDIAKDIIIIDNQFPGGSISASINRVTFANLPASPTTNQVVTLTDGAAAGSCAAGGGTNQVICQWNGSTWVAIGSAVDTTGNFNWSGTHVFTIAPTAAGQEICLEDGTNCPAAGSESDPVIKALKGIVSANGTTATARTITGTTGNVVVFDGDALTANPRIDLGATAVQTDQANTYSGGGLQDFTSNLVTLPNSAAYAPTEEGRIGVNSTTHKPVIGLNGATQSLAVESGNVATATALLNNGNNTTLGQFARGVDASGNAEAGNVALVEAGTPTPKTVEFPGQIKVDSRTYNCSTQAGLPYVGFASGENFLPIAGFQDGYTIFSDGTNTSSPCGADTFKFEAGDNISATVTTGSPDKVVHKIAVASEARGDILFRDASKWTRLPASTNGFCLKTAGAGADPVWASCASTTVNAYWDANGIIQDGTLCHDPTSGLLNGANSERSFWFVCDDNDAAEFQGKIQLPSAITTATFTLAVSDVDSSSQVFAVNVDAQCRGDGTALNTTWGTAQTISITMPTANNIETATSAAVTPNGTCGAGATLFWRARVLGTTTNTDDGDARILSMSMAGS